MGDRRCRLAFIQQFIFLIGDEIVDEIRLNIICSRLIEMLVGYNDSFVHRLLIFPMAVQSVPYLNSLPYVRFQLLPVAVKYIYDWIIIVIHTFEFSYSIFSEWNDFCV